MNGETCTNPEIGALLHAYEIGALPEEEADRFERHLLECDFCYERAESFAREAADLRDDEYLRGMAAKAVRGREKRKHVALRQLLWPDHPLPARPLLLFIVILALIYPAYLGLFQRTDRSIMGVQTIYLVPTRSSSISTLYRSDGRDGVLSFVFDSYRPGDTLVVEIATEAGKQIYLDRSFTYVDRYGNGSIFFPSTMMKPGKYVVEVSVKHDTQAAEKQRYSFSIVN
jgi:hypothetical protein